MTDNEAALKASEKTLKELRASLEEIKDKDPSSVPMFVDHIQQYEAEKNRLEAEIAREKTQPAPAPKPGTTATAFPSPQPSRSGPPPDTAGENRRREEAEAARLKEENRRREEAQVAQRKAEQEAALRRAKQEAQAAEIAALQKAAAERQAKGVAEGTLWLLKAPYAGSIDLRYKFEGDYVKKGDKVLKFKDKDLKSEVDGYVKYVSFGSNWEKAGEVLMEIIPGKKK